MTAITFTGTNPTVGASTDTWGTTLNTGRTQIKADLDMLNTAPTATILGRTTAGTGEVERLTVAQATALLDAVVGATQTAFGTKGLVPAAAIAAQHQVLTGAGTFQSGYGRAFGLVITTTNVNGSQPTFTNGINVASISTVTVGASQSSCTITFTNALPNATYAVHGATTGSVGTLGADFAYGSKGTTSVVVYWGNTAGEISVSGFA